MTQKAYAVTMVGNLNELDLRTVSATQRAAKVNWLHMNGVPIFNSTTDAEIDQLFAKHSVRLMSRLVHVDVKIQEVVRGTLN